MLTEEKLSYQCAKSADGHRDTYTVVDNHVLSQTDEHKHLLYSTLKFDWLLKPLEPMESPESILT